MRNVPARFQRHAAADGSVLPLVLVAIGVLGVLSLAGYETARLALSGARPQVAATAALHAADSGLDLYTRGVGPAGGPLVVEARPGWARVSVSGLVALGDSATLVQVVAEGTAGRGPAPAVVRRLAILVVVDTAGGRRRVPGSWRERF